MTTTLSPVGTQMEFEAQESKDSIAGSDWIVGAIHYAGDGEMYMAQFTGPKAKERAIEYAAWKNAGGGLAI